MIKEEQTLSIWSLVSQAGLVVQLVMLLLLLASIVSWVMIIKRGAYQRKVKSLFDHFEKTFWSGVDLTQLYRQGNDKANVGQTSGIENIFRHGEFLYEYVCMIMERGLRFKSQ